MKSMTGRLLEAGKYCNPDWSPTKEDWQKLGHIAARAISRKPNLGVKNIIKRK